MLELLVTLQTLPALLRERIADSKGDRGATMVEYGLMVALIAVVCIGAVALIGTNMNVKFENVATKLN